MKDRERERDREREMKERERESLSSFALLMEAVNSDEQKPTEARMGAPLAFIGAM